MTLVEFYDERALENIAGILYLRPEKVIFLGSKGKKMKKFADNCREVLSDRGMKTQVESRTLNPNNLLSMVDILCEILDQNEQCEFNLTGGEESVMVALGMVYERFKERVQLHRINLNSGNYVDMDEVENHAWDGVLPKLTVPELVKIYGGTILSSGIAKSSAEEISWTPEFVRDVHQLWNLCRQDCTGWNTLISNLEIIQKYGQCEEQSLKICLSKEDESKLNGECFETELFGRLRQGGYILDFQAAKDQYIFSYKNADIHKCLTKSGTVLELAVYLAAKEMEDEEEGTKYFQDLKASVYLDWDGNPHLDDNQTNTVNEIDVIMMHHLVPYFVSCKNGAVSVDELYKLYVVANHYGFGYARKILVLTDYGKKHLQNFSFVRERAKDLGIYILNEAHQFTISGLSKELKRFCL
ncbi:Domain of uncharacterised function (DUF1887) [uncultured Roseburia sp.]|uniref:DUF1887 family CARF protein n=1 Tax=Brotonthovivens ammoniilytica TaxID=2981725 RepID=A0ABT2TP06_9FIRM|nr:DUF1887 family CARF protein [Brotonthovivens ammoniilytica]MCU6763337.1 DUF1887 family CARF protein [Brotonthovivens ammoniilytica]SCJ14004.1 Domain of uncharacterised function (DUF1887) [uncultured Roseburia sp.]